MHVIYVNDGETKKEAEQRYCAETGSFIGANDIIMFVIYDDQLKSKGKEV